MADSAIQFTEGVGGKYAQFKEGDTVDGHAAEIPYHAVRDGDNATIGAMADAPASVSADETTLTLSSLTALLKASKNLNIDISGLLGDIKAQNGTVGSPEAGTQLKLLTDILAKIIAAPATEAKQPALEGTDKAKVSLWVKKSANGDTVLTLGKAADADSIPVALSTEALAALENITSAIDQTTDGTTNRTVSKISQVAGENHVEILDSSGNGITSTGNALDINIKSGNPTATPDTAASDFAHIHTNSDYWAGESGSVTGAVTDAYVAIKTWTCKGYPHKLMLLKNTDAADALYYKVTGYLYSGGLAEALIAETSLAANTQTALMVFDYPWAVLKVEVKNVVGGGGNDAAYELDWAGGI